MASGNNNVWIKEDEFKPFQDYLGLFNLVKNLNLDDSRASTIQPLMMQSGVNVTARSRSMSSSSAASEDFTQSWDDFKLNGVDVDVAGDMENGFVPFQPSKMNTRKLQGRLLPSAKNRRTPTWCVFCKNNGESEMVYGAHILKDAEGRTSCPILRNYTCPICGDSGDGAHTIKYCPLNKDETFPPSASLMKTTRTSTGKKRGELASLLDRQSLQCSASMDYTTSGMNSTRNL